MKKIVIMMLAVTMILSTLCFGAAAADDLVGTVNSSTADDYSEGASSLVQTPGTGAYDVVFTISGVTAARYAVDVEASNLA